MNEQVKLLFRVNFFFINTHLFTKKQFTKYLVGRLMCIVQSLYALQKLVYCRAFEAVKRMFVTFTEWSPSVSSFNQTFKPFCYFGYLSHPCGFYKKTMHLLHLHEHHG